METRVPRPFSEATRRSPPWSLASAWAMGKMTHQQGEAFKNIRSPGAIKLDLESKLARIVWRSADTFSRCFNCHNDESVGLDY